MTLSLRPLALALTLAALSAGCADKHIGRPCELGPASADGGTSTGTTATIYGQALECPSRICLLPNNETNSQTGPLCTDGCGSNDDCDGEGTGNTADHNQCHTGFVCMVQTEVGDFCCRKLCVCKDFVAAPNMITVPRSCMSGSGSTCKNVH